MTDQAIRWGTHFVDRRVKECLSRMVVSPDKGLLRLIRKRVPKLTPREIVQSLRRLTIHFESPTITAATAMKSSKSKVSNRKGATGATPKAAQTRRSQIPVALADLIAAGLLQIPCRLFRKYKGHQLEATLQPDGKVKFGENGYDSCSTAAEVARGTVTGRRMNTNGWVFWQFEGADGRRQILDELRRKFVAMKQGS